MFIQGPQGPVYQRVIASIDVVLVNLDFELFFSRAWLVIMLLLNKLVQISHIERRVQILKSIIEQLSSLQAFAVLL